MTDRLILLCALAALLTGAQPALATGPFIPVNELKPGLKGYGLSVFKGTEPERFEAEVIAVLARNLPSQDMVLVRLSGCGLERSGIIAGMSGSPVYFDGRLAGAVAYGWAFSKDPIAGVTPIASMLEELHRPAAPVPESTGLRRLAAPLMVSGFSPAIVERLRKRLGPLGFAPFAGAAASGASTASTPEPVPGGALGVQMVRGDWDASAVGTITYVEKDRLVGFGHPLYQLGAMDIPATGARVHTIFASTDFSFKFASPLGPLGSLVEDRQSGVVVARGRQARMVPVHLRVRNTASGRKQDFHLEVLDNPVLTSSLIVEAAASAIEAAEAACSDVTADVRLKARFDGGRELTLADRFHSARRSPIDIAPLLECLAIPANSFGPSRLTSMELELEVEPGRRTAELLAAYPSAREVRPGGQVVLNVALKPYGKPVTSVRVPIRVPLQTGAGRLQLEVLPGSVLEPDLARPEDLDGLLRFVQARYRSTELVVSFQAPGESLKRRGFQVDHAPLSLQAVLGPGPEPSSARQRLGTDWVLTGSASCSVDVRPVAVEK